MSSLSSKIENIKGCIASGETPLAIQELLSLSKQNSELREYVVDVILLSNRLETIKSNEISYNTLNFSILMLLEQMQSNLRQDTFKV